MLFTENRDAVHFLGLPVHRIPNQGLPFHKIPKCTKVEEAWKFVSSQTNQMVHGLKEKKG